MPAARRSKTGAIMAMRSRFATALNAWVLGPGTGSARSNRAASSRWQKYRDRNSSGRQTIFAPARAASSTPATARVRFSAGSGAHAICTRPSVNLLFIRDHPFLEVRDQPARLRHLLDASSFADPDQSAANRGLPITTYLSLAYDLSSSFRSSRQTLSEPHGWQRARPTKTRRQVFSGMRRRTL